MVVESRKRVRLAVKSFENFILTQSRLVYVFEVIQTCRHPQIIGGI